MKANELMVGDWVYCEGQPTPDNVTIETISEDGVWFNGPNYEGAASYDRIFPIPITPEILEKNGFIYNELPFVQGWEQFGLTLTIGGNGFRINCGINVAMIIDSVHELQHALRLCGIDKEIVI